MFQRITNATCFSECCNEYIDMQEGCKNVGNYLLKVVNLVTENAFMNEADLSSFYLNTFFLFYRFPHGVDMCSLST